MYAALIKTAETRQMVQQIRSLRVRAIVALNPHFFRLHKNPIWVPHHPFVRSSLICWAKLIYQYKRYIYPTNQNLGLYLLASATTSQHAPQQSSANARRTSKKSKRSNLTLRTHEKVLRSAVRTRYLMERSTLSIP